MKTVKKKMERERDRMMMMFVYKDPRGGKITKNIQKNLQNSRI